MGKSSKKKGAKEDKQAKAAAKAAKAAQAMNALLAHAAEAGDVSGAKDAIAGPESLPRSHFLVTTKSKRCISWNHLS